MKGIILAGGLAKRLRPLTKITSKQLLPVYNKPMIFYPLETLLNAGIKDILIIIAPEYSGHFLNLLGSGKQFNARFTYEIQEEPAGLADAFNIGRDFIDRDNVTMILGDNIFVDYNFRDDINNFKSGGHIFAINVPDPKRYGVVDFDKNGKVLSIEEKPENPKSKYAIPGIYIFDHRVTEFVMNVKPSHRGEIEIVELHKEYLKREELKVSIIDCIWEDAGTFESLLSISNIVAEHAKKN